MQDFKVILLYIWFTLVSIAFTTSMNIRMNNRKAAFQHGGIKNSCHDAKGRNL